MAEMGENPAGGNPNNSMQLSGQTLSVGPDFGSIAAKQSQRFDAPMSIAKGRFGSVDQSLAWKAKPGIYSKQTMTGYNTFNDGDTSKYKPFEFR